VALRGREERRKERVREGKEWNEGKGGQRRRKEGAFPVAILHPKKQNPV